MSCGPTIEEKTAQEILDIFRCKDDTLGETTEIQICILKDKVVDGKYECGVMFCPLRKSGRFLQTGDNVIIKYPSNVVKAIDMALELYWDFQALDLVTRINMSDYKSHNDNSFRYAADGVEEITCRKRQEMLQLDNIMIGKQ